MRSRLKSKDLFVWGLILSVLSLVENIEPQIEVEAAPAFTRPSQESLWLTADVSTGFFNNHFWSLSTNNEHSVIAPFPHDRWYVYGLGNRWSARVNLDAAGSPYDFFRRRQGGLPWYDEFLRDNSNQAKITFSGFNSSRSDCWTGIADVRNICAFTPFNVSGYIIDYKMTGINFGNVRNYTSTANLDFQFADDSVNWASGQYNWTTGNATASWNSTMQAVVARSTSQNGYSAFTARLRPDTDGAWSFSYSIWNTSASFPGWLATRPSMDNATHGSLPTINANVFAALAYNNTSTSLGVHVLHYTVYVTFGSSINEIDTNLNSLEALDPRKSYEDSNTFWHNLYTTYSAVNMQNDDLNRLYYWSKHLANVGHYAKRYFSAGLEYQSGYVNYFQDSAYGVLNSLSSGLWDNVKRYLDNSLNNAIQTTEGTFDGFNSGTPYQQKNMMTWTITMFSPSGEQGAVRSSLDFLDSVVRYVSYTGNLTFAQSCWLKLTRIIEAVQAAVTTTGVLPLTESSEDMDSSLQCNIIYYHVLKEFSAISNSLGNSTYAFKLSTRASMLKTQLNKNVGSGGLWSQTAGYFVNSSFVSPTDSNPTLWLWHNALAVSYDMADSATRKSQILSAIASKLENALGFYDNQFRWTVDGTERIWYMKLYELAKAYASIEDASKIDKIMWAHVNNPYSGLTNSLDSTRFNFPEYWMVSGITHAYDFQYAWSSSATSLITEILFGIRPVLNNVVIRPIKPSNISTITAINVKVRKALWNVSVAGNGNLVNSISIDGSTLSSQVVPSTYYTGNHTIQVILGSTPTTPMLGIAVPYFCAAVGIASLGFFVVIGLTVCVVGRNRASLRKALACGLAVALVLFILLMILQPSLL